MFSGNKHPITSFYQNGGSNMSSKIEQLKIRARSIGTGIVQKKSKRRYIRQRCKKSSVRQTG